MLNLKKCIVGVSFVVITQGIFAKTVLSFTTTADATRGTVTLVDNGMVGASQGDVFVFDQPLLNANRSKDIGTNSGYCVTTKVGAYSQCQWTLTFKNGSTITVAGQEYEKGESKIPVIGGSGDYTGAQGILITYPNGDRTYTQKLKITVDNKF